MFDVCFSKGTSGILTGVQVRSGEGARSFLEFVDCSFSYGGMCASGVIAQRRRRYDCRDSFCRIPHQDPSAAPNPKCSFFFITKSKIREESPILLPRNILPGFIFLICFAFQRCGSEGTKNRGHRNRDSASYFTENYSMSESPQARVTSAPSLAPGDEDYNRLKRARPGGFDRFLSPRSSVAAPRRALPRTGGLWP